jgi:hypothetical protein
MRTFVIATAAALAFGVAGAAIAGESRDAAPAASEGASSDAIRTNLESMGYRVSRIVLLAGHGRYVANAVNDSGLPIEVIYDGRTGELVRAKLL